MKRPKRKTRKTTNKMRWHLPVFRINWAPVPMPFAQRLQHIDCFQMRVPTSTIVLARMQCAHVLVYETDAIRNLKEWKKRVLLIKSKKSFDLRKRREFEMEKKNRRIRRMQRQNDGNRWNRYPDKTAIRTETNSKRITQNSEQKNRFDRFALLFVCSKTHFRSRNITSNKNAFLSWSAKIEYEKETRKNSNEYAKQAQERNE